MAADILKERARDELIRLTSIDLKTDFHSLPKKQQSIAMAKFYVREIYNPLKSPISEDDLLEGVVDGANDLGCDLIHRDDGHVLIVQSKYRKGGAAEEVSEISHFQSILKRFKNPDLNPNKYLADALADIDWDNDTFELVFISFGRIDGQARKISSQDPNYPDEVADLAQRCEWKFLDENDLNLELRGARNLQRGASMKAIKLFPVGAKGKRGDSVIEVKAGDYRSFIMALDARQLIKCYEELDKDALFSLNIRNFIGNTNTNKAIVKTAEESAENFFLYNNGISCLATKVVPSEEAIEVTGLQVINGAQTVKALVNAERVGRRNGTALWAKTLPTVLVRITEVPENYSAGARVREKITQYNNTQNTIKISDFRSNDDVQTNLKAQFAEVPRAGKKIAYLPKRTDKVPPNSEVIRLEEFAKSVYAFLYDPTAFSGSTSFLFNTDKEGGYIKVFGDGQKIWQRMPDDEFKLRAGIYWLAQEFGPHLKRKREEETDIDSKAAMERKWVLLYAASVVFKLLYPNDGWKSQLRKLYRGDWSIGDEKKGAVVSKIFDAAKAGVTLSYKNNKKYNSKFVHRNWMRGRNTPAEIAEVIQTTILPLLSSISEIPS